MRTDTFALNWSQACSVVCRSVIAFFIPVVFFCLCFSVFSLVGFIMDMYQGRGYQYAVPDRDSLNKGVSDLELILCFYTKTFN